MIERLIKWWLVVVLTMFSVGCSTTIKTGAMAIECKSNPPDIWHVTASVPGFEYDAGFDAKAAAEYLVSWVELAGGLFLTGTP